MRTGNHSVHRHNQRGAASLLVVVVLFFILALVTAYAGRNLIFEQRTSVNNMRATQAFEAAEAGLEYAITQLSGGRVTDTCTPTTDTSKNSFRQRHLTLDASNGTIAALPNLTPTCLLLNAGATCSCPPGGTPLALAPPVGALAPTYQVRFESTAQPGIVRAFSKGCSSVGSQCYPGAADSADAVAEVSVLLGLNSALATPPSAPLTARGNIDFSGGVADISNTDVPSRGITIDAGGTVTGNVRLFSVPGTPGSASKLESDPSLSSLDTARMFVSVFGMDRETYSMQPAAVRLVCTGDCGPTIADAVSANPGRIIWIGSSASIDSNLVLGSPSNPVLIVIHGGLTVSANLQVHGLVYLYGGVSDVTWTTVAGTTLIQGAVIAESGISVVGAPNIVFDPVALRTINLTQGSMVRVPGSWRDFTPGS